MKIKFSSHAIFQMKERGIKKSQVEKAIKNPSQVFKKSKFRHITQSEVKYKRRTFLLRVVYDEVGDTKEIVTVYRTSKFKKYIGININI